MSDQGNGMDRIDLAPPELRSAAARLLDGNGRMQMAYAWQPDDNGVELRYVASVGAGRPFRAWRCLAAEDVPSLAPSIPLLGWYEREITDLFGLEFSGHPGPYPLILHEGAAPQTPPLLAAYPKGELLPFERRPWITPILENAEVQRLPFGPVRADVMESAQFVFFYLGEGILYYQPRLFFKHRGLEKRFEGIGIALGTVLAERVSGVGSVAHTLAYAQAVEAACGCRIPERAAWLRSLLAELERLYNHLHYFSHLAATTTLYVGDAEGSLLEERIKQINARLTGSRFLRAIVTPGGLRRDLDPGHWLGKMLDALRPEILGYLRRLDNTGSHRDRLLRNGVLERQVAFDQGATGPIERASGLDRDLRRDHPYAAYGASSMDVVVREGGDAMARSEVRRDEIKASLSLIHRLSNSLPEGPVRADCEPVPGAEGLGWSESPRGSLFYAVHLDAVGKLKRVKIKSPSFSNWRVFPFTVHGSDMMDYAINEASFGLTVAGCDR